MKPDSPPRISRSEKRNASFRVRSQVAPSSGRFAATFSPRGEEVTSAGVNLFSPAGRRWPEGPDEGAASRNLSQELAGTPSVSEASALAVAGAGAKLLGPRTVVGPVTCAIAISGDAP